MMSVGLSKKMAKFYVSFLISVFVISIECIPMDLKPENEELKSVVVLYRHGDRSPLGTYKNDPYADESYWPLGYGQLTNKGKHQHYELGKWLRNRYSDFLPEKYNRKDIYVTSTDVDRTIMSAESNLAGLYPPIQEEMWNENIKWQPIPVHTTPKSKDPVLAMEKDCDKFDELSKKLQKSDYFQNIYTKYADVFEYVSEKTGETISTIDDLHSIYGILYVQQDNNMTLPDWTKTVYPDPLAELNIYAYLTDTFTPELARLKTGLFFNEVLDNFVRISENDPDSHKMKVYSAHDSTVVSVLNTMGAFDGVWPPYAATVIFELRQVGEEYYINMLYKKEDELTDIALEKCDTKCKLSNFMSIMEPVLLDKSTWKKECKN